VKLRIGCLPPKLRRARQIGGAEAMIAGTVRAAFLFTKFCNSTGENGSTLACWLQIDCYRNQDE
jgi:hypothetical protein